MANKINFHLGCAVLTKNILKFLCFYMILHASVMILRTCSRSKFDVLLFDFFLSSIQAHFKIEIRAINARLLRKLMAQNHRN